MSKTLDIKELAARFGDKVFSWRESGYHYATLNAAVKRGILDKIQSDYKINLNSFKLEAILNAQQAQNSEYIGLLEEDKTIGKLCSIKGATVYDHMGKVYNISKVNRYWSNITHEWVLLV